MAKSLDSNYHLENDTKYIYKKKHTHMYELYTLYPVIKISWTYKEHYKTPFNKFFVHSAYNECVISTWYVRRSVT
jgi:hypothetical protein